MVELNDLGDLLEALLELLDLLEVVTELDDRRRLEHTLLIEEELTVLERVDVALDEEKIGAALHGQETVTRNVNSMSVLEVLNGSTSSSLELD